MQDVSKRVAQILIEKLGIAESEITPDASLVKDLGIDSLDYAEIVMDFEQTFDIKIPFWNRRNDLISDQSFTLTILIQLLVF